LLPNVVSARHLRETAEHALTLTWLPLPGNQLELAALPTSQPEKDHPPLEETLKLQLQERDGWQEWHYAQDLSFCGPADRCYLVDRERGVVSFGDGLTGRQPVLAGGAGANVKVQYQVGGGLVGNLGANLQWQARGGLPLSGLKVYNVVPASGGAEAEAVEAAWQRTASALKQRQRAVTVADYEELARTTPGVAIKRAHVAVGFHPAHPCVTVPGAVTVFIVPDAPREEVDEHFIESAFVAAPVPDPGALAAVRARLDEARLVTTELFVRGPHYVRVSLDFTVETYATQTPDLRARITQRLQTFLDPLVGGDSGQGWPFGEPLRPSALLREAQRALDDDGEAVGVSIKLIDSDQPAQACKDVDIGPHELVALQEVKLSFNRPALSNQAGRGGLR
jgi:predicted phage baseplate assembly protein